MGGAAGDRSLPRSASPPRRHAGQPPPAQRRSRACAATRGGDGGCDRGRASMAPCRRPARRRGGGRGDMSTVLAALDATPAAGSVLSAAVAIGHSLDADVRALHVGSGDEAPRAVAAAVGVPLAVVAGNPIPAIIEAGEHGDVLFVIVGLPRLLPGQQPARRTALSVAARFSKPVVAVPPEERVRAPLQRVLFPLDGTRGVSTGVRSL